ncbi:MAG: MG2 domain-containing protein [Rudaea sp.]
MKRLAALAFSFAFLAFLLLTFGSGSSAHARSMLSVTDRARGLVYDGLRAGGEGPCKGGYEFTVNDNGKTRYVCTDGPSPALPGLNVSQKVAPLQTVSSAASSIVCDGDGQTGNRVQVLYVHAADKPDQYSTYLDSIRGWVDGVDQVANNSAAQTGGSRHVRWVTDPSCNVQVDDVTVSATGDDNLSNTTNELMAQGYSRADRKYLAFVDANVYCGIGVVAYDDQPGAQNANNYGNEVARVDSGCWASWSAAHELMHMLGGVQMTAPHSDGTWHCTDGYDNMCDHGGTQITVPLACSDVSNDSIWDCNYDDYYSTNPPVGSYLATHWNAANNVFLIAPQVAPPAPTPSPTPTVSTPTVRVNSLQTSKTKRASLIGTSTFAPGDTIYVLAHVVNDAGANVSGVSVKLPVLRPDGTVQCTVSAKSGADGTAVGSCRLPKSALAGKWSAHLEQLTKNGVTGDLLNSVTEDYFTVQ